MSMIDNLRSMSREELVKLAVSQGVQRIHHKAKPETIIKQILESVQAKPVVEEKHKAQEPKIAVFHSKEDFEKILQPLKARAPALEWTFDDGEDETDKTITLRCKGAEDCFNMSVGLRWFKVRANIVAQGRGVLRGHDSFEKGNAVGKNAYTNVVLA